MNLSFVGHEKLSDDLLTRLKETNPEHPFVFSTMHPIQSPYMLSYMEVYEWALSYLKEFAASGYLAIYWHAVNLETGNLIAMDEQCVYDFQAKAWI